MPYVETDREKRGRPTPVHTDILGITIKMAVPDLIVNCRVNYT